VRTSSADSCPSSFCFQFDPDFQTPLILGETLDLSDSEETQFVGAFSDGLWAKSEPFLSMSNYQKPAAGAVLGKSPHYLHQTPVSVILRLLLHRLRFHTVSA
jgi:hypothetical protein